jgi:formylglycine-generating enzyme required for sulfatase activity
MAACREKVRDTVLQLRQLPIAMETFTALPAAPAAACQAEAAGADVVVVLVAYRYGYVPSVELGGDGKRSITWLEVLAAQQAGKPVFAFLVDPKAAWDQPKEADRLYSEPGEKHAEILAAVQGLKEFKAYLEAHCTLSTFTNEDDLARKVATTLYNHVMGVDRSPKMEGREQAGTSGDATDGPLALSRAEHTHAVGEQAGQLRARKRELVLAGAPAEEIATVDRQLLELRRQLRDGPRLAAGDCLSERYRLIEEIGQGGFATVWKAYDEEAAGLVAVKVLHGQYAGSAERQERFRRGARAMDALAHPHIVRVLHAPREDGGYHYFVMEYLDGGTFLQAVAEAKLSADQVCQVILEIGDALAHAHRRGQVHRDVTPDNILFDGQAGTAKLTDFDLVRLPESSGGTRTGALGKFIYAAPETMEAAADVDVRCDVYSLGMTALFGFYGKRLPQAALTRQNEFLRRLSLPKRVKAVLARAISHEREGRFGTVDEFCAALSGAWRKNQRQKPGAPAGPDSLAQVQTDEEVGGGSDVPVRLAEETEAISPPEILNSVGMKLVRIPAGKFLMGSPANEEGRDDDEGPQHEVEISQPFYMGVYEVTQEEYQKVVGTNPSWFSPQGGGKDDVANQDTRRFPVERVTWHDAVEFCRKLSDLPEEKRAGRVYHLPTEAEWEYACRGGALSSEPFHFGKTLSSAQANIEFKLGRTTTVGSYPANGYGLHDLHGNVWEWCHDWKGGYPAGFLKDPTGPENGTGRVLRGGSWIGGPRVARSAYRHGHEPGGRYHYIGFRVVVRPGVRTP